MTSANDRTADRVVADLEQRGEAVTRFDVADFPERVAISAELGDDKRGWRGWLQTENSRIGWDEVKSIYYRRPTSFVFPDGVIGSDLAFATAEARRGFGGLLFSLPVRWVNHPSPKEAEFKPMQLDVALSCGLTTPRTLLTSDPDEARLFCETAKNGAIYKPLSAANIVTGDEVQLVFTTRVSSGDFDDADVSRTANLFQEWVPKLYDVRVTAAGDQLFAVAIRAGSPDAYLDWRIDYSALSYEPIVVPPNVALGICAYLERFDLLFGAFDFAVTEHQWYFRV